MVIYRVGWQKQARFKGLVAQPTTKISVIVPARNEEQNIGRCIASLLSQDYPGALLEIIIVDDHSTDHTADIVRSYSEQQVRYINLEEYLPDGPVVNAYKKRALATGISLSKGELIVTTDADCTAGEKWLHLVASMYEQDNPVMVVAPVCFTDNGSLVEVFQTMDFMSMQGITVASLQLGMGNMCNGANLAFSRDAYHTVGGYDGIDHIASGDDFLLMMKMNKKFPGRIRYLQSEFAVVSTPPQPDWISFFNQRIRWASKSGKYDDKRMTAVLLFVYIFNVSFLLVLTASLFASGMLHLLIWLLLIKMISEYIYLIPVARFYNKQKWLWVFPLLQPLHIAYVISAGFLGAIGAYSWKGRKVK